MLRVGFELTIPVFEQAKTFRALDRGTTVTVISFIDNTSVTSFPNETLMYSEPIYSGTINVWRDGLCRNTFQGCFEDGSQLC
jgi:hypothetical protein